MRSFLFGSCVVFFAQQIHAQSGTCYLANGNPLPKDPTWYDMFRPCTFNGPSTTCCALNRSVPPGGDPAKGNVQDECLPNGLCQNRYMKNGTETIEFFTNFCADSNFLGPNCLSICYPRGPAGNAALTACSGKADSEEWCCGANNKDCCSSGVGRFTLPQKFRGAISASIMSSQTNTLATSPASSASPTGTNSAASLLPTPAAQSSLGGGAIAGIVIGALAGIALLAAAIFFALRARRYKEMATSSSYSPPVHEAPVYEKYTPQHTYQHVSPGPVEMAQPSDPVELPSGRGA
ncbi:hypothetical protein CC86DRAFT_311307 [Ophiobolus disseminans]|uniref:Mid2 domain-containing protein n=1 Tax=Ophiobolus disseminans TaxID=1469910 RepID=A0A6A7AL95_9PLEO|nr:hypothetical protein CC86DRAFT_311307 [Ophiobolus disseminans]